MSKGSPNPRAFARPVGGSPEYYNAAQEGMTLRDYFAGKALNGMLRDVTTRAHRADIVNNTVSIAELSYKLADAMLAVRAKGGAQ